MKNQENYNRKLILAIYGINGLINLKVGLTADGTIPAIEMDYND